MANLNQHHTCDIKKIHFKNELKLTLGIYHFKESKTPSGNDRVKTRFNRKCLRYSVLEKLYFHYSILTLSTCFSDFYFHIDAFAMCLFKKEKRFKFKRRIKFKTYNERTPPLSLPLQ